MDWSNKRVLVTGAGGFIGSHLTERLVALGARTRALVQYNSTGSWGWLDDSPVNGDIEVVLGDICDHDSIGQAAKEVDIIFHLAALIGIPYSYSASRSYVRTNVEGTLNVLQAAADAGSQMVIHTSTSEVYGSARYVPMDEEHPLQGQSPYSASKIGADKLAEAFHLSFELPVATIRPFNTFGPRQSSRAVIPAIITQALTQSEVRLGSLDPTRDFNFVADTVEGFVKMAECPKAIGEVINIGSGNSVSIGEVAAAIIEIMGKDIPILSDDQRVRPVGSEVQDLKAETSKAQRILGWSPKYTLQKGLVETIRWIEGNIERYRPNIYTT